MAGAGKSAQAARNWRERWLLGPSFNLVVNVDVPANVERRTISEPCFRCEARGDCKHRRLEAA
jgi:hypothetical protein